MFLLSKLNCNDCNENIVQGERNIRKQICDRKEMIASKRKLKFNYLENFISNDRGLILLSSLDILFLTS